MANLQAQTIYSCGSIDQSVCSVLNLPNIVVIETPTSNDYFIGGTFNREYVITLTSIQTIESHIAFTYKPANNIAITSFVYAVDGINYIIPIPSSPNANGEYDLFINLSNHDLVQNDMITLIETFIVTNCSGTNTFFEFVTDNCHCFQGYNPSPVQVNLFTSEIIDINSTNINGMSLTEYCNNEENNTFVLSFTNNGDPNVAATENNIAFLKNLIFGLDHSLINSDITITGPSMNSVSIYQDFSNLILQDWVSVVPGGAYSINFDDENFPANILSNPYENSPINYELNNSLALNESFNLTILDYQTDCANNFSSYKEINKETLISFTEINYENFCGSQFNPRIGHDIILLEEFVWESNILSGGQSITDIQTNHGANLTYNLNEIENYNLLETFATTSCNLPKFYVSVTMPIDYTISTTFLGENDFCVPANPIQWVFNNVNLSPITAVYSENIIGNKRELLIELPADVALNNISQLIVPICLGLESSCGDEGITPIDNFDFQFRQACSNECPDCYLLIDQLTNYLVRHCQGDCGDNAIGSSSFDVERLGAVSSNGASPNVKRGFKCDNLEFSFKGNNLNYSANTGDLYLNLRYRIDEWNINQNITTTNPQQLNILQPVKLTARYNDENFEIYGEELDFYIEYIYNDVITTAGISDNSNTKVFINNGHWDFEGKLMHINIRIDNPITFPNDVEFILECRLLDGATLTNGIHNLEGLRGAFLRWNGGPFEFATDNNIEYSCDDYGSHFEYVKTNSDLKFLIQPPPNNKCEPNFTLKNTTGVSVLDYFPNEIRQIKTLDRTITIDIPPGMQVPMIGGLVDFSLLNVNYVVRTYNQNGIGTTTLSSSNNTIDNPTVNYNSQLEILLPPFNSVEWDTYEESISFALIKECASQSVDFQQTFNYDDILCGGSISVNESQFIASAGISINPSFLGVINNQFIANSNPFTIDVRLELLQNSSTIDNIWIAEAPNNGISIIDIEDITSFNNMIPQIPPFATMQNVESSIWNLQSIYWGNTPSQRNPKDIRITLAYDCATDNQGNINDILSKFLFGFSCTGNLPTGFDSDNELCWSCDAQCMNESCTDNTAGCDANITILPFELNISETQVELTSSEIAQNIPCSESFNTELTLLSTQLGAAQNVELHIKEALVGMQIDQVSVTLFDDNNNEVVTTTITSPTLPLILTGSSNALLQSQLQGLFSIKIEFTFKRLTANLCLEPNNELTYFVVYNNLCEEVINLSNNGAIDNNTSVIVQYQYNYDAQNCPLNTLEIEDLIFYSTTCGDCNGSLSFNVNIGLAPYTYDLKILNTVVSSGSFSNSMNLSNLCEGNYILTVIDNNGCEAQTSFYIAPSLPLSVTADVNQIVVCPGGSGSIENVVVSNGSGNYSYSWSNGSSATELINLTNGTYNLTLTDLTTGCVINESFIINPFSGESLEYYNEINCAFLIPDFNNSGWCGSDNSITFTTTGATPGTVGATCSNTPSSGKRNVWFKFEAPSTREVEVELIPVNGFKNFYISIWKREGNGELAELKRTTDPWSSGCNYTNYVGNGAIAADGLIPGVQYYLMVDNYNSAHGDFQLCFYDKISIDFAQGDELDIPDFDDDGTWCSPTTFSTTNQTAGLTGANCSDKFKF
jgi:hypothetical protein